MSRWSDVFESHGIHDVLRDSRQCLDKKVEDTNLEFENERRRLIKVINILQGVVSGIDPEFFPVTLLDQINNHLRGNRFLSELQTYSTNPQLSHLQNANDHLTDQSHLIYQLSAMARLINSRNVIKTAEDAFTSFAESMETTKTNFEVDLETNTDKLEINEGKLDTLDTTLENLKVSTGEKQAEWQVEFTKNQTERAEEYSTTKIDQGKEFAKFLSEWITQANEQTDNISSQYNVNLEEEAKTFNECAKEIKDDMNVKHERVLKLYGLVGQNSVAGGYQEQALAEEKSANLWRWISVGSMAAAVLWIGTMYLNIYFGWYEAPKSGTFNWTEIIRSYSLSAILLTIAGYASSQSKMHRNNRKHMLSFALETKALDPFMASLKEDQQQEIKAEIIRRMFGQQHNESRGKDIKLDDATIKTLAGKLKGFLGKTNDD